MVLHLRPKRWSIARLGQENINKTDTVPRRNSDDNGCNVLNSVTDDIEMQKSKLNFILTFKMYPNIALYYSVA